MIHPIHPSRPKAVPKLASLALEALEAAIRDRDLQHVAAIAVLYARAGGAGDEVFAARLRAYREGLFPSERERLRQWAARFGGA